LLLAGPLLLPDAAVGQGRPGQKKNKAEVATPEDYATVKKMKEISGVVTYFNPTENTVTLRVEYNTYEPVAPKGGAQAAANRQMQTLLNQQQSLNREYQNILRIKNPVQQQQRLAVYQARVQQLQLQMAAAQNPKINLKAIGHAKEIEFDLLPDVKLARKSLPLEYDDKGQVKEYTEAEKKKLRSPDLAGYKAKVEDLEPGQTVTFYLAKPKPAKKAPAAKKEKAEEGDAKEGEGKKVEAKKVEESAKKVDEQPKGLGEDAKKPGESSKTPGTKIGEGDTPDRPLVRMVLILTEADPALVSKDKGRRKKKD